MEWIDVRKQLPDSKDEVEVFLPHSERVRIAVYDPKRGWIDQIRESNLHSLITHWRKIELPPIPPTLVYAYYDTSMSDIIHLADGFGNPACGTQYGGDGEFLSSQREYDLGILRSYMINPRIINCKRCQRIQAKGGKQ